MEINTGNGQMMNLKKGTDTLSVTVGDNSDKEGTEKTVVSLVLVKEKTSSQSEPSL